MQTSIPMVSIGTERPISKTLTLLIHGVSIGLDRMMTIQPYYLSITVEINTAYEGRNDNVGGFFGRDNKTGTVYLFHTGRVGGGTKGVSQKAFLAWIKRRPDAVFDSSGDPRFGVLVMPIQGLGATKSLLNYIEAVAEFKKAARDGALGGTEYNQNRKELEEFYSEARGRRKGRRSAIIDYVSRHGDVVDALRDWRLKQPLKMDATLVKNVLIDLGVRLDGLISEIFEVKTSADRGDVYTAVGSTNGAWNGGLSSSRSLAS
jgi:hypothetical protein